MKIRHAFFCLLAAIVLSVPATAQPDPAARSTAAEAKKTAGKLLPVTENERAWADKAREAYPLKECVVSGESLDSMGGPAAYIYRVAGEPDQLVLFCCDGCEEDFMKDPAAHLEKLKPGAKSPNSAPAGHSGHGHHKP